MRRLEPRDVSLGLGSGGHEAKAHERTKLVSFASYRLGHHVQRMHVGIDENFEQMSLTMREAPEHSIELIPPRRRRMTRDVGAEGEERFWHSVRRRFVGWRERVE